MKKKGFLLAEQVVKIVIALIGLSFLLYFLSSLYFNKIDLENQEKAADYLLRSTESLKNFIENSLSEENTEFFNPNVPNGWYLFSYTGSAEKPNRCDRKNCLCVCDNVWDFNGAQIKQCNEKGSCLPVYNLKNEALEIELTVNPATTLIIKNVSDIMEVSKK
jgi:hypothetical protein